jgi:hypothetical protein
MVLGEEASGKDAAAAAAVTEVPARDGRDEETFLFRFPV